MGEIGWQSIGRKSTTSGIATIVKSKILADQEWASNYNRTAFVNAAAACGHASICRGTTSYGAQGHFHPAHHAFTPHQLHGGLCVFHCISRHFSEVRPKWERGYSKLLNHVQYDAKRGHSLKASDVGALASTAGRILVEPGEIDLFAMRSRLGQHSGDAEVLHDDWLAMLRSEIPGLTKEIQYAATRRQRPDSSSPCPDCQRHLGFLGPMITRQVDKFGRAAGHATRGCVSLVPAYFQARMSSHPAVALMQLAAIQLTRIGAAHAVRQLAFVHDAIFMAIALNRVLPPDKSKVHRPAHHFVGPAAAGEA